MKPKNHLHVYTVQDSLSIVSSKPRVCWIFLVINRRLFCSHFNILFPQTWNKHDLNFSPKKKPYLVSINKIKYLAQHWSLHHVIDKIKYLHNIDYYTRSKSCQWFWNPNFFPIQKMACKQQMPQNGLDLLRMRKALRKLETSTKGVIVIWNDLSGQLRKL
jgi:hypothetical protein